MVQLHLPGYEGPLELLLQLIEKNELEISEVSLIQVADQYMEQLDRLEAGASRGARDRLADDLADFIVIGARLMLLKSRALLPRDAAPALDAEEEDVGRELVDMLEEYRRYKQAAAVLETIDRAGFRSFRPGAPVPIETPPAVGLPDSVTLDLLTRLVREAFARAEAEARRHPAVDLPRDPVTVRQKIDELWARLQGGRRVSFRSWIAEALTRVDVIVTFLAILELYKARAVEMTQDETYGDILVEAKAGAPADAVISVVDDEPAPDAS